MNPQLMTKVQERVEVVRRSEAERLAEAKVEWDTMQRLMGQCRNPLQLQWFEGRISGFVQWVLRPNGWWVHCQHKGEEVPVWERTVV